MNHGISILFRAIPLAMAAFCFGYGAYVFAAGSDPSRLTAGPVVFFLGSICVALYCTAATIIRQIIGTYSAAAKYLFPAVGYAFAAMTVICGIFIITSNMTGAYVTGHVVCGLGLITACVSTAATSSTRFSLIPKNSGDSSFSINPAGFSRGQSSLLIFIVSAVAAGAWLWCILLFSIGTLPAHIVAGSVMFGIACVCTSLIALVASIARQARGSYTMGERRRWMSLVLCMGGLAFVLGIVVNTVATFEKSGRTTVPVIIEGERNALVEADDWEIELALLNLMKNSADAFAEIHPAMLADGSPRIRIRIEDHEDCWWIRVIDNAKLVKPEFTDRFFQKLETSKAHGLGLGLSIVSSLAERHAGRVWAEPNPGRGVIVTIELPKYADLPGRTETIATSSTSENPK